MLAHELRNPLAPIHNAVQLMHRKSFDGSAAQPGRATSSSGSSRTSTRLVDDLLDVSRITRGKINLNKEVIELGTLVTRTVETVQPLDRRAWPYSSLWMSRRGCWPCSAIPRV